MWPSRNIYTKFDSIHFDKQVLRLWPANLGLGEGYICDSIDCKTSKDEVILNSGYNRLNCFVCDYDLCMTCANRLVCQKQNGKKTFGVCNKEGCN